MVESEKELTPLTHLRPTEHLLFFQLEFTVHYLLRNLHWASTFQFRLKLTLSEYSPLEIVESTVYEGAFEEAYQVNFGYRAAVSESRRLGVPDWITLSLINVCQALPSPIYRRRVHSTFVYLLLFFLLQEEDNVTLSDLTPGTRSMVNDSIEQVCRDPNFVVRDNPHSFVIICKV